MADCRPDPARRPQGRQASRNAEAAREASTPGLPFPGDSRRAQTPAGVKPRRRSCPHGFHHRRRDGEERARHARSYGRAPGRTRARIAAPLQRTLAAEATASKGWQQIATWAGLLQESVAPLRTPSESRCQFGHTVTPAVRHVRMAALDLLGPVYRVPPHERFIGVANSPSWHSMLVTILSVSYARPTPLFTRGGLPPVLRWRRPTVS